tara:strand:+ start:936 stop:1676 length:741 start_codon:yes stop_codon:yes gene_type:complete
MTKKIISKKWQINHAIISSLLSILAMILVVTDSEYNSFLNEGILMFILFAFSYWFVLLIVVTVLRSLKMNILSNGWLRLHIIISLFGGLIYILFYSLLIFRFDSFDRFAPIIFIWPLIYWTWILLNYSIKIYNNNLMSKKGLFRHFVISLFISILFSIFVHLDNHTHEYLYSSTTMQTFSYGSFLFLISYLILFIIIWIRNGFKESEVTNEAIKQLKQQKELLDLEIITQEEYNKIKEELKSMIKE